MSLLPIVVSFFVAILESLEKRKEKATLISARMFKRALKT